MCPYLTRSPALGLSLRGAASSNCRFNADANTGHAFGIFMASVGTLRLRLRRRLTWALGVGTVTTRSLRHRLGQVIGGAMLLGLAWFFIYSFVWVPQQMRRFCEQIPLNTSPSEVLAAVKSHGLDATELGAGTTLVTDESSFGRFSCRVQYGKTGVESARYLLND